MPKTPYMGLMTIPAKRGPNWAASYGQQKDTVLFVRRLQQSHNALQLWVFKSEKTKSEASGQAFGAIRLKVITEQGWFLLYRPYTLATMLTSLPGCVKPWRGACASLRRNECPCGVPTQTSFGRYSSSLQQANMPCEPAHAGIP